MHLNSKASLSYIVLSWNITCPPCQFKLISIFPPWCMGVNLKQNFFLWCFLICSEEAIPQWCIACASQDTLPERGRRGHCWKIGYDLIEKIIKSDTNYNSYDNSTLSIFVLYTVGCMKVLDGFLSTGKKRRLECLKMNENFSISYQIWK